LFILPDMRSFKNRFD